MTTTGSARIDKHGEAASDNSPAFESNRYLSNELV